MDISEIHPQLEGELIDLKNQAIFNIPWGDHIAIISKCNPFAARDTTAYCILLCI